MALAYNHGKKYSECSNLLNRAQSHAQTAMKSFSSEASIWSLVEEGAAPGASISELIRLLNVLIQQADAEDLTCRASYMLDSSDKAIASDTVTDADLSSKVLLLLLNELIIYTIVYYKIKIFFNAIF